MKTLFLFLLSTLASRAETKLLSNSVVSDRNARQLEAPRSLVPRQFASLKVFKVETVPPASSRLGAKRQKFYYGPISLVPANARKGKGKSMGMDPNGNVFGGLAASLPRDVTLLFQNTTLQYKDGRVADQSSGVYNHHIAFLDPTKRNTQVFACKGRAVIASPSAPIAASEDVGFSLYTTNDWKFNSGYYIGKQSTILAIGEVINYSAEPKKVYVVSEIEYVPGKPSGAMDVSIQVLSVNQCESLNIALRPPPGQNVFSFKSQNISVLQNGYILSRRGHLHDGGVNIEILVNGKLICNSKAIYGGEKGTMKTEDGQIWETISASSECTDPVEVAKGDIITLQANYDLVKHPARKHADNSGMAELMGQMSFGFALAV